MNDNRPAPDPVKDALLRRMNHREWLRQAAIVFENQWTAKNTIAMTPFRAGIISRLRMAAEYIELLEREARDTVREIEALKHDAQQGAGQVRS